MSNDNRDDILTMHDITSIIILMKIVIDASKRKKIIEILFFILCGLFYLYWSFIKPYNYGPDEYMRYPLAEYIYLHNRLPIGDDPEIITPIWGFSYAFLPTWLGPISSAICMKIMGVIHNTTRALVVAARFPSVISGILTVWFMKKA